MDAIEARKEAARDRSRAYYQEHRDDKEWMARHAARQRAGYIRRGKMRDINAAILATKDLDSTSLRDLDALEHLAWIAWKYRAAMLAAGVKPPFELIE